MPLLDALARFNHAHPWSHNAHFHRWIMRQLPRRFDRALDVGCGAGDLARLRKEHQQGGGTHRPGIPQPFSVADAVS